MLIKINANIINTEDNRNESDYRLNFNFNNKRKNSVQFNDNNNK